MDAPPAPPVRQHARIAYALFFGITDEERPGHDERTTRVPGKEIGLINYAGGNLLVVQALPDGRSRQWFNVPCMIEYEAPTGLVLPSSPARVI